MWGFISSPRFGRNVFTRIDCIQSGIVDYVKPRYPQLIPKLAHSCYRDSGFQMRKIRATLALIVGLLITGTCAVVMLTGSLVFLLPNLLTFGLIWNPFAFTPWLWNEMMYFVCYRGILGVRIEVHGAIPPRRKIFSVILSNHADTFAMPLGFWIGTRFIHRRPIVFQKIENQWDPVIGIPMWIGRMSIFFDRDDRKQAIRAIERGLRRIAGRYGAVTINPDGTRPTKERIAVSRRAHRTRTDDCAWMQHTCMWRSGGTLATVRALHEQCMSGRMVVYAHGFARPTSTIRDMVGQTYHVSFREMERFPLHEFDAQRCMRDLCRWANIELHAWRHLRRVDDKAPP